jgi:hypothetical protein
MSRQIIYSNSAPILWSTVDEAFNRINDNFTELYLSIGGGGAVDLTSLSTSVIPSTNETFDLGSPTKRWRDIYLSGSSIHLGTAVITSTAGAVNLPAGSTIGSLALDENYFKTIAVAGQANIVADTGTDTLTIAASNGIALTTTAGTDTLTIANSGVLTNAAGTGITVSGATGNVTITNAGVLSTVAGYGISVSSGTGNVTITNTGIVSVITDPGSGISLDTSVPGTVRITNSAPSVPQNIFQTIAVSGQSNVVADLPTDTLTLVNGTGISITTNAGADSVTFTNSGVTSFAVSGVGLSASAATGSITLSNTGVVAISAGDGISINQSTGTVVVTNTRFGFTSIAVGGQSSVLADNSTDTLVLVAGEGIQLTTNAVNDSITFDVTYLKGSVFSDASTMVINGATGTVVGPVATSSLRTDESQLRLGYQAGLTNQGSSGIAIGYRAGKDSQGQGAISIGDDSGLTGQGYRAVAIGFVAATSNQGPGAIAIGDGTAQTNQGGGAIAIGSLAGSTNQGASSIAIGYQAGATTTTANSIILNASGSTLDSAAAGFYVAPIREVTGPQTVYYNPVTYEVTWGPVPAGGGGGGGTSNYEFSVAGDDSTQRVISNGETLRFAGASGITTTTDGEGRVTITGPTLAAVATSGTYSSLTGLPSIPAAYSATSIDALSDVDTTTSAPTNGQTLVWSSSSSKWLPGTISGGGGGTLAARAAVAATTASLANTATGSLTITGYKGYMLYKIQTSAAAWVRIYTDIASRTADSSRVEGADPTPGSGVVAEVITTGAQTILISPGALGFSNETVPDTNIQLAVTNKSGGTTTITVTLTAVQLEA